MLTITTPRMVRTWYGKSRVAIVPTTAVSPGVTTSRIGWRAQRPHGRVKTSWERAASSGNRKYGLPVARPQSATPAM